MTLRRRITTLLAGAALTVGVLAGSAGCSSTGTGSGSLSYAPAAYGQQSGSVYDCYYISTPLEVSDLENAGLCPRGSVATLMPISWQEEYWAYYSSPAYYDDYMPVSYRSHYTSVTIGSFSRTYSRQISTAETRAVYKSSSGSTVTGTSKLKFGAGTTTSGGSAVHGGGSARTCSIGMAEFPDSGSHGGGSARSGGSSGTSGSGSRTGSGSRGTC